MSRTRTGRRKPASKASKTAEKRQEKECHVVSSSNMAADAVAGQQSLENEIDIVLSGAEDDSLPSPLGQTPPPLVPLGDVDRSRATIQSAVDPNCATSNVSGDSTPRGFSSQPDMPTDPHPNENQWATADDHTDTAAPRTSTPCVDSNVTQPSNNDWSISPLKTGLAGSAATGAGPSDDSWFDESSFDHSQTSAMKRPNRRSSTPRWKVNSSNKASLTADASRSVAKDWLDSPPNLDPETCDLIYLAPKHLRSGGNCSQIEPGMGLSSEVRSAVDSMHALLEDHKAQIAKVRDLDRQLMLHSRFVENPLVKQHYDVMLKHISSLDKPSQSLMQSSFKSVDHSYSTEPVAGPSKELSSRDRGPNRETFEGTYTIELISKNVLPIDTAGYVNSAIADAGCSVHVNRMSPEGPNLTVAFRSRADRDKVLDALRSYKYISKSIDEYYTVNTDARSSHLFRTTVVSKQLLNSLQFMKEGKFKPEIAIQLIASRNKDWFRSQYDIIDVQLKKSTEPAGALLQIFTTEYSNRKITAGIAKGMNLDLVDTQLPIHHPVKVEWCFRCTDPGHRKDQCKGPLRCRFCILSHGSKGCPHADGPYVCFRCREFNLSLKSDEMHLKKGENHTATTVDCPFYRELRKKVLAERKPSQRSSPAKRRKY